MDVFCNHLIQICRADYSQWHNAITLDIERPNTLVFNDATYVCRWTYTMSPDGQWSKISFSFNRHFCGNKWWTEHYVRIGNEVWSLLYRTQTPQQHNYCTTTGRFHNVPLKLLRLQACERGVYRIRHNAEGYSPIHGFFWNATAEAPGDEECEADASHHQLQTSVDA